MVFVNLHKPPPRIRRTFLSSFYAMEYLGLTLFDISSFLRLYFATWRETGGITGLPFLKAAILVAHESASGIQMVFGRSMHEAMTLHLKAVREVSGERMDDRYYAAQKVFIRKTRMVERETRVVRNTVIGHRFPTKRLSSLELGLKCDKYVKLLMHYQDTLMTFQGVIHAVGIAAAHNLAPSGSNRVRELSEEIRFANVRIQKMLKWSG